MRVDCGGVPEDRWAWKYGADIYASNTKNSIAILTAAKSGRLGTGCISLGMGAESPARCVVAGGLRGRNINNEGFDQSQYVQQRSGLSDGFDQITE